MAKVKDERIKIGQKVVLKPVNNTARYIKGDILENLSEGEITKVGRKYLTVSLNKYNEIQFELDGFKHKNGGYCADYELYFSRQVVEDEIIRDRMFSRCQSFFGYLGNYKSKSLITKEELETITSIIEKAERRGE